MADHDKDKNIIQEEISAWFKECDNIAGKSRQGLADAAGVTKQSVFKWIKFGKVSKENLSIASKYYNKPLPNSITGKTQTIYADAIPSLNVKSTMTTNGSHVPAKTQYAINFLRHPPTGMEEVADHIIELIFSLPHNELYELDIEEEDTKAS